MSVDTQQRTNPAHDLRRVILFGAGLIPVYVAAVVFIIATHTETSPTLGILFIMFGPTVGALLARLAGPGQIRWGRPSWWIIAGLLPTAAVLLAYVFGSMLGVAVADYGVLGKALLFSPISIVIASGAALGEEIGWRGFLWPLLRGRWSFLTSALVMFVVWWAYHVPLIIVGWYGSLAGLAAFTVAVAGITLFIGVVTDRARSIWPSVVAHGAWNALAATGFAMAGSTGVVGFSGSTFWVGEFGWLAAVGSLTMGVLGTWWHLSHPMAAHTQEEKAIAVVDAPGHAPA
jgi:membrane protease YdiL (CAAX protease family)